MLMRADEPAPHQGPEGMDDVHDGHGDGKTCNSQCANGLTKEHSINNIIDRRDNLTDYSRHGVGPEEGFDTLVSSSFVLSISED